jgi:hypothetical protein
MTSGNVRDELASTFAERDRISEASFDVADLEPTLVRLREYLRAIGPNSEAETFLVSVVNEWSVESGSGVVEALEFTMRELRWEGVRLALLRLSELGADFRVRDLARHALEVYEDDWPGGEVYSTYRSDQPQRRRWLASVVAWRPRLRWPSRKGD